MSDARSARVYAIAASPGSTSPESSCRRTNRDPPASSAAATSPYETTRGRRGDSQIRRGARAEVSWRVDDSAVTRHERECSGHEAESWPQQASRCRRVGSVRCCCSCLNVSRLTLPQTTFVCPSVVDASPWSPTVLSCGLWSVDVNAAVSVQRTAAMSGVASASWCCSRLDFSCSSLPRSTSVCPSVVDGRSSVPSTCTPDDSCTLPVD